MKNMSIVVSVVALCGCGAPEQGSQGTRQVNGSCSVANAAGVVTITCPDGTSASVRSGADGVDGRDGVDGASGVRGPQGPQGPVGAPGAQGLQGPAGAVGSPGATGPTGPQGAQGPVGPKGAPGVSFSPQNMYEVYNYTVVAAGLHGYATVSCDSGDVLISGDCTAYYSGVPVLVTGKGVPDYYANGSVVDGKVYADLADKLEYGYECSSLEGNRVRAHAKCYHIP